MSDNPQPPQKPTIDERLDALTMNVELLAASTRDLRAVAEAEIGRRHEQEERLRQRDERDRQYLKLVAAVLEHWANGTHPPEGNAE